VGIGTAYYSVPFHSGGEETATRAAPSITTLPSSVKCCEFSS